MTRRSVKSKSSFSTRHIELTFWALVSFLFLFQGRWAFSNAFGHDESCYLEYLHRMVGESFPGCYSRSHFWGVSLTWIPAGLISKAISLIAGISFKSVVLPLIGLTSYLQWVGALFILDKVFQRLTEGSALRWQPAFTVLLLFATPATYFSFRTTYFSHSAELILMSGFLYAITYRRYFLAAVAGSWVFLTRLNDLFVLGMLLVVALEFMKERKVSKVASHGLFALMAVLFVGCSVMFYRIAFVTGYNGYLLSNVLGSVEWKGLEITLFHVSHGILTQHLLWLALFLYLACKFPTLDWMERMVWLGQASQLLLYVSLSVFWGFSESRYLLASYLGAFWILARHWNSLGERVRLVFGTLGVMSAVWNLWFYLTAIPPVIRSGRYLLSDVQSSDSEIAMALLLHPIYTILALVGLSPIGFSFYSWFPDLGVFQKFSAFRVYALTGSARMVLTISALVALAGCVWMMALLYQRIQKPSPLSQLPSHRKLQRRYLKTATGR